MNQSNKHLHANQAAAAAAKKQSLEKSREKKVQQEISVTAAGVLNGSKSSIDKWLDGWMDECKLKNSSSHYMQAPTCNCLVGM